MGKIRSRLSLLMLILTSILFLSCAHIPTSGCIDDNREECEQGWEERDALIDLAMDFGSKGMDEFRNDRFKTWQDEKRDRDYRHHNEDREYEKKHDGRSNPFQKRQERTPGKDFLGE